MKQTSAQIRSKYLVGIDEVGRGPIAGPVAVGAFIFLVDEKSADVRRLFRGVRESKQLSEARREEWFTKILQAQKAGLVDFEVSFISERIIDTRGLSYAIRTALEKSLRKVTYFTQPARVQVLLDGGLHAPADFIHQQTIIKGDAKKQVIALASICAKVLRDRRMHALGKKHPKYGFEVHKGYGTKGHYRAIEKHGLLSAHRRSFLRKYLQKRHS